MIDILGDDENDASGRHFAMMENEAAIGMGEPEWRRLVLRRFNRQDRILNKIAQSLDIVAGVRLGGSFAKWMAPIGVLLLAVVQYFHNR